MRLNNIPREIVRDKAFILSVKLLFNILWCDQVIVSPEEIKIIVLSSGISKGLKGLIPIGGHCWPISIDGDSEE